MITAILGFIGNDLGGLSEIGWMVTAWSIASAVTFSIGGSLSDIFGRRYMILFGQLMTLVGSVCFSQITTSRSIATVIIRY